MKSGRNQPVLASANQFTPMTQKNGPPQGTPINFLRLSDLETPKSNKKSNTSSEDKNLLSPELNTPKAQPIDDDDDIFAIRQAAVDVLERIDRYIRKHNIKPKSQDNRRAMIQNPPTPLIDNEPEPPKQNYEPKPAPIMKKRKASAAQEKPRVEVVAEPPKPAKREKSKQIAVPEPEPEPQMKKAKPRRRSSKSSSSDATEVKTISLSPRQSTNSLSGSFSTESDGKSLQERMHQMSIILRNLELQLDDIGSN